MKIAIVTMHGPNYSEIAAYTVPIMSNYAYKHGYKLYQIKLEDDNQWAYKKHEFFKKLFDANEIDAILYVDVDAVITNHDIKVEELIDKEHSFFITKDFNEINGGVVIVKNTDDGRKFNDMLPTFRNQYENEQNVYNKFYPDYTHIIKILPQSSMNAYDYSLYPECISWVGKEDADWKEGDFILHVPAIQPLSKRLEILKNAVITR